MLNAMHFVVGGLFPIGYITAMIVFYNNDDRSHYPLIEFPWPMILHA